MSSSSSRHVRSNSRMRSRDRLERTAANTSDEEETTIAPDLNTFKSLHDRTRKVKDKLLLSQPHFKLKKQDSTFFTGSLSDDEKTKDASKRQCATENFASFDAANYFITSLKKNRTEDDKVEYGQSLVESSPPIPFDSMISAEEVIRESIASNRSASVYRDRDDFALSRRSDSLGLSFSTRSTFRRSTISEQLLRETDLFAPERELSMHEISEVLTTTREDETRSIEVTSIKEEEQTIKREHAKYRWAQHVKLKARNLFFTSMSAFDPAEMQNQDVDKSDIKEKLVPNESVIVAPKNSKLTNNYPGRSVPVSSLMPQSTSPIPSFAKWNRWMQDQYQTNFNNVKLPFGLNNNATINPALDPMKLISLEEIISNSQMMRYYAAWLRDPADHNKLFFLCSFQEYRRFWCTLRASYIEQEQSSPLRHSKYQHNPTLQRRFNLKLSVLQPFSRDDVLLLRTYGVKIAQKYLAKNAQFHIGQDLVTSDMLQTMKLDIAAGGEDALRAFDSVASLVKQYLMHNFAAFRKSQLFPEMIKTVPREVVFLEDILMNHRFANFFWIFLFPHNYHREIALWLDIEYEFKPSYRIYVSHLRNHRKKNEKREVSAHRCRKLVRYIVQKYYTGEKDMQGLDRSLTAAFAKLQQEQDTMIDKFNSIHLELYHRFITSRAYAEFSLYNPRPDVVLGSHTSTPQAMDDFQRIASLLLEYGLRAHSWPEEMSRDAQKKRSLEILCSSCGYEAISGVLTFEAIPLAFERKSDGEISHEATRLELRKTQYPLPHDPQPNAMDKMLESFILPWSSNPNDLIRQAPTCPPPIAFNFRMGDNTFSTEVYAACVVMYKPAPPFTLQELEQNALNPDEDCRWIPYGICITSKFALVDLLRERLSEAYEYLLAVEALEANVITGPVNSKAAHGSEEMSIFQIDKSLISKLSRTVRLKYVTPVTSETVTRKSKQGQTKALLRLSLPLLDHSVRLLFDVLDIPTVLLLFSAVLLECRVLFISSHTSVLMKIAESTRALMYPLLWPHVYLPVLPCRMLQYLECPTPFIFGVVKDYLDQGITAELYQEEILILDLDCGMVLGRGADIVCAMPKSTASVLRRGLYDLLRPSVTDSDHIFAHQFPQRPYIFPDNSVRILFQEAVQDLISEFGYHRYVWRDEYAKQQMVFFDEASYLAASTPDKREFLALFIATQAFSELIVSFSGFEGVTGRSESSSSRSLAEKDKARDPTDSSLSSSAGRTEESNA